MLLSQSWNYDATMIIIVSNIYILCLASVLSTLKAYASAIVDSTTPETVDRLQQEGVFLLKSTLCVFVVNARGNVSIDRKCFNIEYKRLP